MMTRAKKSRRNRHSPPTISQFHHPTFANDVIELVGGQNGSTNPARLFLLPAAKDTFTKYRRVGVLFVLLVARILQAEYNEDGVYHDPNVRCWHRLGRPTLDSCMQNLAVQHEK